jgi:hypothetical protein
MLTSGMHELLATYMPLVLRLRTLFVNRHEGI